MARHQNRAQVTHLGRRLKSIHENDAWQLVWAGWAMVLMDPANPCRPLSPLVVQLCERRQMPGQESDSGGDAASITVAEMLLNALADLQRRAGEPFNPKMKRLVIEAENKVRWWPRIGDTRAVRVGQRIKNGASL